MKSIFIIFLFTITTNLLFAQNNKFTHKEKKQVYNAEMSIMDYNYKAALKIYEKLIKNHSKNHNLLLNGAYCYYELNNLDSAISLYSKVTDYYEKKNKLGNTKAQTAFYYLGLSYYKQYNAEEAKKCFQKIEKYVKSKQKEEIEKRIAQCDTLKNYLNNPIDFISYRAVTLNSSSPDYAPVFDVTNNILYFTSRRKSSIGKIDYDGYKPEDVFFSTYLNGEFSDPVNLREINTGNYESTSSISLDGKTLFISNWNGRNQADIFITKKVNNKWQKPELLPKPINKESEELDACISPDNKTLIFSSNRRGGEGGFDLYKTSLDKKGKWTKAINLGSLINTEADEVSPVFSPDGTTLYFSSNRNDGVGGFDIYEAKIDTNGNILETNNLGFPLNTTYDDIFYCPTLDPAKFFYVSKRENGDPDIFVGIRYGLDDNMIIVKGGVYDITVKQYPIDKIKNDLVFANNRWFPAKGLIETKDKITHRYSTKDGMLIDSILKIPDNATINVFDITKGINIKTTHPFNTGLYVITLDKYSKYLIKFSAPNYLTDVLKVDNNQKITTYFADLDSLNNTHHIDSLSQIIAQNNIIDSNGYVVNNQTQNTITNSTEVAIVKNGVNKVVNEMLFNIGKYQSVSYNSDLDALAQYLIDNPSAKIGIYGYTDTQGNPKFNEFLSQKRAEFVKNYLISKGAKPEQIVAEGRGFTKQISINKDENGNYSWSSLVYNRRVEFEIIQPGKNYGLVINKIPVPEKFSINSQNKQVYSINLVSSKKPIPFNKFDLNVIQVEWSDHTYSYVYGYYPSFESANEVLQKLLPKYPNARVFTNSFSFNK